MTVVEKQAEIARLRDFFSRVELPKESITIEGYITLLDTRVFKDTNLERAEKGINNSWHDGALLRLQLLEKYLLQSSSNR